MSSSPKIIVSISIELSFENQDLVRQLRVTLTQADEANNAKSVFLNSASHDLRQPLHALALMTEVMGSTELNERQAKLQDSMMSAVDSTRNMLDSLLNMSKIEAGATLEGPKPFRIQTIFNRIEAETVQTARQKGLSYRARTTAAVANSDILIVELILRNLESNATRYTNTGRILVACRKRRSGMLAIEVWDTGVGIQRSKTKHIFKPFQQLNNPDRDSNDGLSLGLGLGLAITQRLADTIGTSISLDSVAGLGSVFRFELPIAGSPIKEVPIIKAPGTSLLKKRRFLLSVITTVR